MGFFDLFKKKETNTKKVLIAPITGDVVPLDTVKDETFASKMLGDGVAIEPKESGVMLAPMDGIVDITPTLHAFTLESSDGVSILVHLGVDTVKLNGKGFEQLVESGTKVKAGDGIIKYDLAFLKENAPSVTSPVIVLESDEYKNIQKYEGQSVHAGQEKIIEIEK
ncbi:PTS glucose transporter subunit IIA [uncultured Sneathia sp.]|jgi:hypothetical protein|uniref:PTS sugar transporter subunit IIA n=1 Tax=uncultured Sneathia sp. TaxID=278067 RepID=UPI00259928DB|nr:PTS glucose transporter subunit IIA [uncultured Sneathia sp.]